jgi:hypothetical protein
VKCQQFQRLGTTSVRRWCGTKLAYLLGRILPWEGTLAGLEEFSEEPKMNGTAVLAFVLLGVTSVAAFGAAEVTLLEPQTCTRTTGANDVYTYGFPGLEGSAVLTVQNGDGGKKSRITSATIELNGAAVLDRSDFKRSVYTLEVPINVLDSNSITARTAGKPGSYLTITVVQQVDSYDALPAGQLAPTGCATYIGAHPMFPGELLCCSAPSP